LLALVDESGAVVAAQTITAQEKSGSGRIGKARGILRRKRAEQPQSVVIAEGLATALTCHLMRPDALTVCRHRRRKPAARRAGNAPALPGCADHHRRRQRH
jgi:hypothetical protein